MFDEVYYNICWFLHNCEGIILSTVASQTNTFAEKIVIIK